MNINETLENLRGTYLSAKFDESDCEKDPVSQFDHWLEHAIETKCDEPNAFVLSTVKDGRPRGRVLLLKGITDDQFVFYTNYNSAKGSEINLNDNVSMTFLWLPLHRQVRIEGTITKVTEETSDQYFHKRPRGSQIGAIASPQSQKVSDRKYLEDLFHATEKKFESIEVLPRPKHWGGYSVKPTLIEFWQGRNNRLHDRMCFEKKGTKWELYRLAP